MSQLYGPNGNALFPNAAVPSDAIAPASMTQIMAVLAAYNGGTFDLVRQGDKILNFPSVAITAGTASDRLTPTSGKKFRVHIVAVSLSVSGSIILKYGSGPTEFLRVPTAAANTPAIIPNLGKGIAPGAVNDHLLLDANASGNVNGFLIYSEE